MIRRITECAYGKHFDAQDTLSALSNAARRLRSQLLAATRSCVYCSYPTDEIDSRTECPRALPNRGSQVRVLPGVATMGVTRGDAGRTLEYLGQLPPGNPRGLYEELGERR